LTTVAIAMAQHRTTIALVTGIIFRIVAARSKPWRTKSLIASVKAAIVMTSSSPDRVGFQCLQCRPLRRAPRRALPRGARRARRRVLHARGVKRRAPTALVVLGQLEVKSLTVHPDGDVADAGP